ncbi:MAG: methylenetetrahydrofolate reductase [Actinomycetes bacterium]
MTKIADLLSAGRTVSFEFFPPKSDAEADTLAATLRDLEPLDPSFVSVTYRGGAESRQRTYDLVTMMEAETTLTPMAHLICVAHTVAELTEILEQYREAGIENLMALGGDPPSDPGAIVGELTYASELVALARDIGGFSIGIAAHPAGHPRSTSMAEDRDRLAAKLSAADFAVTQFFFSLEEYTSLVEDLAERGVKKPVLPGIMPVTSITSVPRMADMGAPVPQWAIDRLEAADAVGGSAAVRAEGIVLATELCAGLLEAGAPGLHFYTLNRSLATREIAQSLGLAPH